MTNRFFYDKHDGVLDVPPLKDIEWQGIDPRVPFFFEVLKDYANYLQIVGNHDNHIRKNGHVANPTTTTPSMIYDQNRGASQLKLCKKKSVLDRDYIKLKGRTASFFPFSCYDQNIGDEDWG